MKTYKYNYRRYNEHDVLKVNLPTLAGVLYLSRHVLGLFVIGMALRGGRSGKIEAGGAFDGLFEPIYMVADIPALLVLLAIFCRHPKSGRSVRLIWRTAPYLLLLSAVLYLGLLADQIGLNVAALTPAIWMSVVLTIAVVGYVFAAPYACDLFHQFPESQTEDDASRPP